jgi:hypothetical protein
MVTAPAVTQARALYATVRVTLRRGAARAPTADNGDTQLRRVPPLRGVRTAVTRPKITCKKSDPPTDVVDRHIFVFPVPNAISPQPTPTHNAPNPQGKAD